MKKLNPKDLNPEIFELYDQYAHNQIDRRVFVKRLSVYAVGGLTLGSLMSFMMPDYIHKIQVKGDDKRLNSEFIIYNSEKGGGEIKGLLSSPKKIKDKLPGVIVVHENRGLNPHIEDVGRRTALEGFISLAPDALSPLGGYPGNDDDGRELQRKRDKNEMLEDFIAAYEYLLGHPDCNGKVGVVGFCFGGWISNMMAVRIPGLSAAVPFYGSKPTLELVDQIQSPLMLQFAGLDKRVNAGWPDYEKALKSNNKKYEAFVYPEVQHGFHNDTTPRYSEEAAKLAWDRTIEFFKSQLV
ncbi:MAG: dienelactone hydrolase family protein [Reichenbachiella sp.]